jgi:hypothetical protein
VPALPATLLCRLRQPSRKNPAEAPTLLSNSRPLGIPTINVVNPTADFIRNVETETAEVLCFPPSLPVQILERCRNAHAISCAANSSQPRSCRHVRHAFPFASLIEPHRNAGRGWTTDFPRINFSGCSRFCSVCGSSLSAFFCIAFWKLKQTKLLCTGVAQLPPGLRQPPYRSCGIYLRIQSGIRRGAFNRDCCEQLNNTTVDPSDTDKGEESCQQERLVAK